MFYSKTSIGYNHIKNNTDCQDFSSSYHDEERTIITTCDGHGGNIYIRSKLGSKFASVAILKVFMQIERGQLFGDIEQSFIDKLRMNILCEWNLLVERDLAKHPITKRELSKISEDERFRLLNNKVKAYGTTLIGAMKLGKKLIVIKLGDGEALLIDKGTIKSIIEEDEDEPVANVTYSMCADDAYDHIKIKIIDLNHYDAVVLCTDGVVNPYQNYQNFNDSFIKPLIKSIIENKNASAIDNFVIKLGNELGIGDDVSLSFITNEGIEEKYYK